jgi:hypothetical protein
VELAMQQAIIVYQLRIWTRTEGTDLVGLINFLMQGYF